MEKLFMGVKKKVMNMGKKVLTPLKNESGASIVEILGYALLAVLAIVVVWGLISGWIPTFFDYITGKLKDL